MVGDHGLGRGRTLALAVLVALFCATGSAVALSAGDGSATHRYLNATLALHRREAHNASKGGAAIEALTVRVKSECPLVLSASPLTKNTKAPQSERPVFEEMLLDPLLMLDRAAFHGPLVAFDDAVRRLSWSNRFLTRVLRSFTKEGVALSDVTPPDICADMEAWVKSGYSTEPAGTAAFLHRFEAAASISKVKGKIPGAVITTFDQPEYIATHLKPYETPGERRLARRILTLSQRLSRREGNAVEAFLTALYGSGSSS